MLSDALEIPYPTTFFDLTLIGNEFYPIKTGKEATVYVCEAGPAIDAGVVAAKVYHTGNVRSFQNDAAYREGRFVGDSRLRRAMAKKTRAGRKASLADWVAREYEVLGLLHRLGADVPEPLAFAGGEAMTAGFQEGGFSPGAILMEYVGDESGPAPLLKDVKLDTAAAQAAFDQVLRNVELFLENHVVHGDLSPYNVLYGEGGITVIDFPQSVDARVNGGSEAFLTRDVTRVCDHFAKLGVDADGRSVASDLWWRYTIGDL